MIHEYTSDNWECTITQDDSRWLIFMQSKEYWHTYRGYIRQGDFIDAEKFLRSQAGKGFQRKSKKFT